MKKILIIILASLASLVFIAVIWEIAYLRTTTKQEVYILPQGFKGIVLIAYDQKDGLGDIIEDGKIIYKIPRSGVLKLKRKEPATLSKAWYYFEDAQGKQSDLYYCFPPCDQMKTDTSKIFAFGSGNMTFLDEQPELKTSIFLVGTANDTDSLSRAVEKMNAIELIKNTKP